MSTKHITKIFSIEGNIGSGKSTFLSLLSSHIPNITVIPEPVAEWQNIANKYNLLEEYYKDTKRWAYTFQINAILSRMKQLNSVLSSVSRDNRIFFSERSVVADREIFAKLLHGDGNMNDMEYDLYIKMYNSLDSLFKTPRIHKFIYLKTTPEKCLERTKKRARHEEVSISFEYLQRIHKLHENWLNNENKNVLEINGTSEFETNEIKTEEMVKKVKEFLQC